LTEKNKVRPHNTLYK